MTHEEILQGLYDNTLIGNAPEVRDLVNQGLEDELEPEKMLYEALIPSLEEVGARFERGDFFVPEMLIAARAMQGALDILRPLLAETGVEEIGTFVMGTVIRSRSRTFVIGPEQPFCVIGERINPTGRTAFQAQLQAGDLSQLDIDVAEQVAGGADALDVNVGDPLADEVGLMRQAVT